MSEALRIATWERQLGPDGARAKARETAELYLHCIDNPGHYAHQLEWARRFEATACELYRYSFGGWDDRTVYEWMREVDHG